MTLLSFWLSVAVMSLAVFALAALALRRGGRGGAADERALKVHADQLREIERDTARGLIPAEEAERLRSETARRLLAADRAGGGAGSRNSPPLARAGALLLLLAGAGLAIGTYLREGNPELGDAPLALRHDEAEAARRYRQPQAELTAEWQRDPRRVPELEPDGDYAALLAQLRAAVAARPDDLTGHRLLARNEAGLNRFEAAAEVQGRVVALLPATSTGEEQTHERVLHAQYLIAATGGTVSPEAEAVLEAILARDARNGFALFFVGVMFEQTGRPDLTFRIWRDLLANEDPSAPWIADIRANIEMLAAVAGERYSLPATAAGPGPSAEDIAATMDQSPEERAAMIGGMIDGLMARLASQGGPAEDWARLIHALTVVDQRDRAESIRAEARMVFAADPAARALIEEAGRDVPVAPASPAPEVSE